MDSLTQIVLGASVGEAVLGKQAGNRAALWGAVVATLPDLDVIFRAFGTYEYLLHHRGFSHSLLFCLVAAPLLGRGIDALYKGKYASPRGWTWLSGWALLTHVALDCFTSWGTQVLYPFSDYRVALNSIFIIDPLYTLPFLLCLLLALRLAPGRPWRRTWNTLGLVLSTFYLLLTLTNKAVVNAVFTNSLHLEGKSSMRKETFPTPFNNIMWYVVSEEPTAFNIGYYSLLSDEQRIRYQRIPKSHRLLEDLQSSELTDRLAWMSKGYFSLDRRQDTLIWRDLRFGIWKGWEGPQDPPVFPFQLALLLEGGEVRAVRQGPPTWDLTAEALQGFWQRIIGRPPSGKDRP